MASSSTPAAFLGCVPSSLAVSYNQFGTDSLGVVSTRGLCQHNCVYALDSTGHYYSYDLSFYDAVSKECHCSWANKGANAIADTNFLPATSPTSGTCASGAILDYLFHWDYPTGNAVYPFQECFNGLSAAAMSAATVSTKEYINPALCLFYDYQATYAAVAWRYTSSGSYQCLTWNSAPLISTSPVDCGYVSGQSTIVTYGNVMVPSGGGTRRRRSPLQTPMTAAAAHCPDGMSPCLLQGSTTDYECLDISQELNSCGGCLWGQLGAANANTRRGINCETISGAAEWAVTCERGNCMVNACLEGWELIGNDCVLDALD